MTILLAALASVLFLLFLWQRAEYRALCRELRYIQQRLESGACTKENAYILVPSDHAPIQELAAALNRLADEVCAQKADYARAKQAMVQMLANISHDLRTPLTVLKGYSEWLGREAERASAGQLREMTDKINRKADELVAAINEYFTLSKITSGDRKLDLQQINVTALCHEVILDYYDILEREQYQVEIDLGPLPAYARADRDALERILKNLIDNAVRHGGSGKYLALRLRDTGAGVTIEVEDHGPGIAEKEREQIFCRSYTTAPKGCGSGLGLTIAKSLALQMDAALQFTSEPGRRTVFALLLKR